MKHFRLLLPTLLMISASTASAQAPVYYDDVLLIINESSEASDSIGSYFAEARGIPEHHIVRLETSTNETISDATFSTIRTTVETAMEERNLVDSINYIVTTKGLPLRINRPAGDPENGALTARRASFESELMLINGPLADSIGSVGWFFHSYGLQNEDRHFDRRDHGFYLVTRLDAYSVDHVIGMIDDSGPNRLVEKDSVLFVLDREPGARDAAFDQSQIAAAQILETRGWPVLLNSDSVYVTDQRNVLGYASWGSNDRFHRPFATNGIPRNSWSIGALAETFVSTSARSLQPGTTYGQSLIADWLAEGVVGAKGYVFEPFTVALAFPHVYLGRYTDETQDLRYNMAESFAMASRTLSWMEVVLGDPKSSIITAIPSAPMAEADDTTVACSGSQIRFLGRSSSTGIHAWFRGDPETIAATGNRFDKSHPLWIGEGRSLSLPGGSLAPGAYTYVVTNISGHTMFRTELVLRSQPDVLFSVSSDTVGTGAEVRFLDETESEGIRIWNFGDGNSIEGIADPVHSFDEPGTYLVRLSVDNGGCSDRRFIRIVVIDGWLSVRESSEEHKSRLIFSERGERSILRLEPAPERVSRLRIFDRVGRLIQTVSIADITRLSDGIPLVRLATGHYFVLLERTDGTTMEFRFRR